MENGLSDPRTGTDSRTFELQLFTIRGSFSPQSVHPCRPLGHCQHATGRGIGLHQEGGEEGATKATVVRITIIISRP